MSEHSAIEWTDATWNPVRGCEKVSPGCAHCYAETFAERWRGIPGHPYEQGFDLRLVPEKLQEPFTWKTPRRVFVNSMSDLFQDDVPDQYLHEVYHVMEHARQHTFQVLTKRAARMQAYLTWRYEDRIPSRHIWHGVSVENQIFANERIPLLMSTPSAVRFISAEPLLSVVNLDGVWGYPGSAYYEQLARWPIHWVIVGGESGHGARPMHPDWARSMRDQCQAAGVPFFFKQWGEWLPISQLQGDSAELYRHYPPTRRHPDGRSVCKVETKILQADGRVEFAFPKGAMQIFRVGKHAAGRMLDGREWNEFPGQRSTGNVSDTRVSQT